MPAHQFVGDALDRIGDGEATVLRFELGDEDGLEKKVAELITERRVIVAVDRLEHFVRFLEDVRLQRVDRLLAVPGAAVWRAEPCDDVDEPLELAGRVWHGVLDNLII